MDPQATLYSLLDAINRNDRVAVDTLLSALLEWNRKGGFLPVLEKIERFDGLYQVGRKAPERPAQETPYTPYTEDEHADEAEALTQDWAESQESWDSAEF